MPKLLFLLALLVSPLVSRAQAFGGSLTLSVNSLMEPIDISLMYSGVSKKVLPYFNIGFPFGYR